MSLLASLRFRCARRCRPAPRRRLRVEAPAERLESRTMLTAYVVNSLSDAPPNTSDAADGELTLREAIQAANTDAAFGDAAAGSGLDTITFDTTLFGSGSHTITLEQGDLRLLDDVRIDGSGVDITIDGVARSRHFRVVGGVRAELSSMRLFRGRAGIAGSTLNQGTLTLDDMTFESNTALGTQSIVNRRGGGGVFNLGRLFVSDTTFDRNRAIGAGSLGGGIHNAGDGTVQIDDSDFLTNRAAAGGGGLALSGKETAHRISGVLAARNSAGFIGAPAPGEGGFAFIDEDNTVRLDTSILFANSAREAGGGVYLGDEATLFVEDTRFSLNEATEGFGGGGIFNDEGFLDVSYSRFAMNTATGDFGAGGAILTDGGDTSVLFTEIVQNEATDSGGGMAQIGGTVDLSGVNGSGNTVFSDLSRGGFLSLTNTLADVELSRFAFNSAGDAVGNDGLGGAIHADQATVLAISDAVLADNFAFNGGGLFNEGDATVLRSTVHFNEAAGRGGGILSSNALFVERSDVSSNSATDGGGIAQTAGTVDIVNTILSDNFANSGGAINVGPSGLSLTVALSTITGNGAANGGGINFGGGQLDVFGSVLFANTATGLGGGIRMSIGMATLADTSIFSNDAAGGGGLHAGAGTTTTLLGVTTIAGNFPDDIGGGGIVM